MENKVVGVNIFEVKQTCYRRAVKTEISCKGELLYSEYCELDKYMKSSPIKKAEDWLFPHPKRENSGNVGSNRNNSFNNRVVRKFLLQFTNLQLQLINLQMKLLLRKK